MAIDFPKPDHWVTPKTPRELARIRAEAQADSEVPPWAEFYEIGEEKRVQSWCGDIVRVERPDPVERAHRAITRAWEVIEPLTEFTPDGFPVVADRVQAEYQNAMDALTATDPQGRPVNISINADRGSVAALRVGNVTIGSGLIANPDDLAHRGWIDANNRPIPTPLSKGWPPGKEPFQNSRHYPVTPFEAVATCPRCDLLAVYPIHWLRLPERPWPVRAVPVVIRECVECGQEWGQS